MAYAQCPVLLENLNASSCATIVYVPEDLVPYLIGVCHYAYETVIDDHEALRRLLSFQGTAGAIVHDDSVAPSGLRARRLSASTVSA